MQGQYDAKASRAAYVEAFNRLGVEELLAPKEVDRNDIFKAVFYSETEDDAHTVSLSQLFIQDKIVSKDGELGDNVLVLRSAQMLQRLSGIEPGSITVGDIVELRKTLLDGVFQNSKYADSTRRYRITNGTHVTPPVDIVERNLERILADLNKKPSSRLDVLVNAAEFHAGFIGLHPFEDGNGRTSRLLSSWYLAMNGMNPMHVSNGMAKIYTTSTHGYYISKHKPFIMSTMLMLTLGREELEELVDRAMKMEPANAHEAEIRQSILLINKLAYHGTIDMKEFAREIESIYGKGLEMDVSLAFGALWMSVIAKADSPIIERAYTEMDPRLRNMAVYAMGAADFAKYKDRIVSALFNDPDEHVREQAIFQLGLNGALTSKIFAEAIERNKGNEMLLVALGKNFTYGPDPKKVRHVDRLMQIGEEMGSVDVRLRAYQPLMVHASNARVINVIKNELAVQEPVIKKEIIVELSHAGRLNDDRIAAAIAKVAGGDDGVLKPLLGELTLAPKGAVNAQYLKLASEIAGSNGYTGEDRAYAAYLIGREYGFTAMRDEYGIKITDGTSDIEMMAITMVFSSSLNAKAHDDLALEEEKRTAPKSEIGRIEARQERLNAEASEMFEKIIGDIAACQPLYAIINARSVIELELSRRMEKQRALFESRRDSGFAATVTRGMRTLKQYVDRLLLPSNQDDIKALKRDVGITVAEPKRRVTG